MFYICVYNVRFRPEYLLRSKKYRMRYLRVTFFYPVSGKRILELIFFFSYWIYTPVVWTKPIEYTDVWNYELLHVGFFKYSDERSWYNFTIFALYFVVFRVSSAITRHTSLTRTVTPDKLSDVTILLLLFGTRPVRSQYNKMLFIIITRTFYDLKRIVIK